MTKKIVELAEALPREELENLLHVAEYMSGTGSFYNRMNPDQRAELDLAIDNADADQSVSPAELEKRLDRVIAKHGK